MVGEGERLNQECRSSVLTVSTPPPTLSPSHGSPTQCTQSLLERKQKDTCFRCGKQGHWAEDCHTSPTQCTQSPIERKRKDTCFRCGKQGHWAEDCLSGTKTKASPPEDIHQLPVLRCHCGVVCTISVSHTKANPGRRYYSRNCNCGNKAGRGKSFFKWCDEVTAPMCKCGAGACTINIMRDNDGEETKYYTCRIAAGHGACGFLQKDKRPSILSPPNGEPTNVMAQEDEYPIPSFSCRDIVVRNSKTCNSVRGKGDPVSGLPSRSDIRSQQIEFWNQISAATNSPDQFFQMLGFDFRGWLGRLALPPPRTLEEALPTHFFCVLVSAYVDVSDGSVSSSIIPRASSNAEVNAFINDTELPSVPLRTSTLKRSFTLMKTYVKNPSMKTVEKKPQKDVLCLLESMEPADDDSMSQATNATSNALASAESIHCTSRVPQMESTIQDSYNQQVPTINISTNHAEAFAALSAASTNYLRSVDSTMASHFKDMLGLLEKFETCLLDIAKDMGQSRRRMQAAYQELTEA